MRFFFALLAPWREKFLRLVQTFQTIESNKTAAKSAALLLDADGRSLATIFALMPWDKSRPLTPSSF
jgi:hypothetical protein